MIKLVCVHAQPGMTTCQIPQLQSMTATSLQYLAAQIDQNALALFSKRVQNLS